MKLPTSRSLISILVLLTLFSANQLFAAKEKYSDYVTGDLNGKQVHLTDQRYSEMNAGNFSFKNEKVNGRIILSIDPSNKTFQPVGYTATVVISGTYYTYDGTNFKANAISSTLEVNYTADGTAYTDKNILSLPGAHKIDITVVSSTLNPSGAIANLKVSAEIDIERYYDLDLTLAPTSLGYNNMLSQTGELVFHWQPVANAEEYDLEWTFVNDYGNDNNTLKADEIEVEKNLFKYNSTRVTTKNTYYKIPYIYDRGYILYRVRAIGRSAKNNYASTMEGSWSFDPFVGNCTKVSCFPDKFYSGTYAHQPNLNWQFTSSYAEEGKSKVVLNYFDGIFRDRQSVTRINSRNKSLVAEKVYDYQSRPAIQILPVPANDNSLNYREMFNVIPDGSKPYGSENFDTDQSGCLTYPSPMGTQNGASNYYSPANPNKTGHNAYIPDAEGYPFIQTEYTPDNTGRVKTVSMPGPVHQLPSSATTPEHVTRNYYGTPNKESLDALFGSEAGDASHYKKNMVKDPNGQMSISYIDMAGRTVATSLAGASPDNLLALNSSNTETVTVDLLNKIDPLDKKGSSNTLHLEDMTIVLEKKIVVPSEQKLSMTYELQGESYTNNCSNTIRLPDGTFVTKTDTRCYNCVYDLAVSLSDNCGNEYLTDIKPSIDNPTVVGQDILNDINADRNVNCSTQGTAVINKPDMKTSVILKPGDYSLRKILKVNKKALDYYTDQYFQNNNCLLDLDYFTKNEYLDINFSGCLTCDECQKLTGDYSKYDVLTNPDCEPCLTKEQYDQVIAQCEKLCESDKSTKCKGAYYAMLGDMAPGGQYGEYRVGDKIVDGVVTESDNDECTPEKFPLSIFNHHNQLPQKSLLGRPDWRRPSDDYYKEDDGTKSLVQLVKISDTEYEPAVVNPTLVDENDMTEPTNLLNVKDFIANWRPSWAQSLVVYHPEYPLYELCGRFQDSHDFDYEWMQNDYSQVSDIPSAWKQTLNNFKFEDFDPFFNTIDPSLRAIFVKMVRKALNKYTVSKDGTAILSVWQVMWQTAHLTDNPCSNDPVPADPQITSVNEWNIFKALYNSVKMKFEQKYTVYTSIRGGYYNGCIGDKKFSPKKDFFIYARYNYSPFPWMPKLFRVTRSQFFNYVQPCNYARYQLYKEKEPRFQAYQDLLKFEFEEGTDCNGLLDSEGITDDGISMEETVCPEGLNNALKEAENVSDLAIYKMCGQCPLARDIQELLKALVKKGDFLATRTKLNCTYAELTEDLKNTVDPTKLLDIYWTKELYLHGSTFEAKLHNTSFVFKLPANSLYDFSDFKSLCCLSYQPNPSLLPQLDYGNFSITATVTIKPSDPDYIAEFPDKTKEITIEGYCGIDLKNCTFQPVCTPSQEASEVLGLLNTLVMNDSEIATPVLTSTTPVSLTIDPNGTPSDATILYSTALTDNMRTILDDNIGISEQNTNWHWVATSISGGTLSARIQDGLTAASGECDIVLEGMPAELSYNDIASFSNIKPYDGDDYDFTITALVKNATTRRFVTLRGNIAYFPMGTCETAAPNEWDPTGGISSKANTGYFFCKGSETAYNILSFLNSPAPVWSQYTNKEYVILDIPAVNSKIELWMPPMSDNFFSDVASFSDIEPDQEKLGNNTSTKYFIVTATKNDGSKVLVRGYCYDLLMGNCYPTVNTECPTNNAVNMVMEQLNSNAKAGLITSNTVAINYINGTESITLNFTSSSGLNYTDIQSFSHIIPKTDVLNNDGTSNQFYIIAHMKNGEINQMVGTTSANIATSNCHKTVSSSSTPTELVKNGNFDSPIADSNFPDKICSSATSACAPTTQLMNELQFQTELLYKYSWGNSPGIFNNYGTFHIGSQMSGFLPTYSGNGLFVDGNIVNTGKNYTIVWLQEIDVVPGKDYDFSCLLSNLQGHGPAVLDVVQFDNTHTNYTSLLTDGASVQVGSSKPYFLNNNSNGLTIDLFKDSKGNRMWYKVKRRFNSQTNAKIILAIIDYSFTSKGNDFVVDNISLKAPGFVSVENAGYSESKDFMCNVPDFNGLLPAEGEHIIKETPCVGNLKDLAKHTAQVKYDIYREEQRVNFREEYIKKCLDVYEKMSMTYVEGEDHYTLYYYDQAGNLVRTVPPQGVKKLSSSLLNGVNNDRINNTQTIFTNHDMVSTYKYNSLNQLVAQSTPDMEDLNIKEVVPSNTGIPSNYEIKDITFADPGNGYAIANDGNNGHFLKTTDAGKTWTEITGMGIGDIMAVKFISENVVIAVGERGLIMKSTDAGATWIQKTINTQGALMGLYFSSASHGLMMEQNGRIWTTSDAGETWQGPNDRLTRMINGQVKDITFTNDVTGYAVISNGKVYKTVDGGATWEQRNIARANNLASVTYYNNIAYAAGENGTILKKVLGNWEKIASTKTDDIQQLHLASENQFTVLTADKKLWYSEDKGITWLSKQSNVKTLNFVTDQVGYLVTSTGSLLTTVNGGKTWLPVTATKPVTPNGFYLSGSVWYLTGTDKSLYRSADNGLTWTQVNTSDINAQFKAFYVNEPYACALTTDGILWTTQNVGEEFTVWTKVVTAAEENKDYNAMSWSDPQHGVLIKSTGKVLNTQDAGATWSLKELTGISGALQSVAMNTSDIATVVGTTGESWTTIDGGSTWDNESNKFVVSSLNSIQCINNQCFAVGNNGNILQTTDGGTLWNLQNSHTCQNLQGVDLYDATHGFAVGDQGTVVRYDQTWSVVPTSITNTLYDVSATGSSNGIAVGAQTTVAGGSNWTRKTTPSASENLKVVGIDPDHQNHMVAAGQKGKLYRSTNGGDNWSLVNALVPVKLNATQLVNTITGYAVGDDGEIYQTSDAGVSWKRIGTAGSTNLRGLYFVNVNSGMVIGESGVAYTTSNAGATWTPLTLPVSVNLNNVCFATAKKGFIAGDNGVLLTSQNGIAGPWTAVTLPGVTAKLNKVYFLNGALGFVVGASGTILRSVDAGATWSRITQSATSNELVSVHFNDTKIGYIFDKTGSLIKTLNGGDTWELQTTSLGSNGNAMTATEGNDLFISGTDGNVVKVKDFSDLYSTQNYYDRLGRLVASQNAKQYNSNHNKYSYTIYDEQNRIAEVGEVLASQPVTNLYEDGLLDNNRFIQWITQGTRTEVTHTYYDETMSPAINAKFGVDGQQNLRSRVASTTYEDIYDNDISTYTYASHFSYDMHGNIKKLIQDNPALAAYNNQDVVIEYDYDLISNKINVVKYQEGKPDQFFHRYEYDADNRITHVYTSRDNAIWDEDASYTYYDHGTLARTELGENKVQGVDYAYTIHGWLKGINSTTLQPNRDMGKDGSSATGNPNANIPADLFGYALGYYNGDYKAINSSGANHFEATTTGAGFVADAKYNLYNGNIGHTISAVSELMKAPGIGSSPQVMGYQYDQLNRLIQSREFTDASVVTNNIWTTTAPTANYSMDLTYDPNGNIKTLKRVSGTGVLFDDLEYKYENVDNQYLKNTNKLRAVLDHSSTTEKFGDLQSGQVWDAHDNSNNNYGYDEAGNLIWDKQEEIENFTWTVTGKIKKITRLATSIKPDLEYVYDATGNRIMKIVKPHSGGALLPEAKWTYTFYTRDAQGNILSTYKRPESSTNLLVNDFQIYGSNRLGTLNIGQSINSLATANLYSLKTGAKNYELSNHLGNVTTVFSDRLLPVDTNGDGITDYYQASVVCANDYYPFGMIMPNTNNVSSDHYRFGFNGKEKDDDVNGTGVTYDYGFRIYDSRIGKFLSVDPLTQKYPELTPYQFAGNSPIQAVDLDGQETYHYTLLKKDDGTTTLKLNSVETEGKILWWTYKIKMERDIITYNGGSYWFDEGNNMYDPFRVNWNLKEKFIQDPDALINSGKARSYEAAKADWYMFNFQSMVYSTMSAKTIMNVRSIPVTGQKALPAPVAQKALAPYEPPTGTPNPIPNTAEGFVVAENGTAVNKNAAEIVQSLTNVGFVGTPTTQTTEPGTKFTLPTTQTKTGTYQVRIMQGQNNNKPFKGPRVITTTGENKDYRLPDATSFPNGTPASVRETKGHIHLTTQ